MITVSHFLGASRCVCLGRRGVVDESRGMHGSAPDQLNVPSFHPSFIGCLRPPVDMRKQDEAGVVGVDNHLGIASSAPACRDAF